MTKQEIKQKLEQIQAQFEELSFEPEFTKISKDSSYFGDISLNQAWMGIEQAVEMLSCEH